MDKSQLKRLKQLSRSELLEVMLALKRENDILMMENVRLKTLKHKLEHDLQEITDTLKRIECGSYEADFSEEITQDDAWKGFGSLDENAPMEEYVEPSFNSIFDSYTDEVTNK